MTEPINLIKKKPYSDQARWIAVHPAYLNSKKTLKEGRRLPTHLAVENPNTEEIFDILKAGGFAPIAERKMYPRDRTHDWAVQGRVKVQLKNDDGSVKYPELPNKFAVYKYVCEMIPKLKSRQVGTQAVPTSSATTNKKNKKKSNQRPIRTCDRE